MVFLEVCTFLSNYKNDLKCSQFIRNMLLLFHAPEIAYLSRASLPKHRYRRTDWIPWKLKLFYELLQIAYQPSRHIDNQCTWQTVVWSLTCLPVHEAFPQAESEMIILRAPQNYMTFNILPTTSIVEYMVKVWGSCVKTPVTKTCMWLMSALCQQPGCSCSLLLFLKPLKNI